MTVSSSTLFLQEIVLENKIMSWPVIDPSKLICFVIFKYFERAFCLLNLMCINNTIGWLIDCLTDCFFVKAFWPWKTLERHSFPISTWERRAFGERVHVTSTGIWPSRRDKVSKLLCYNNYLSDCSFTVWIFSSRHYASNWRASAECKRLGRPHWSSFLCPNISTQYFFWSYKISP